MKTTKPKRCEQQLGCKARHPRQRVLGFGAEFMSRSDVNADHKAAALRAAAGL